MTIESKMSWREARALLMDSGRGGNEAHDILDELARQGPEHHGFSVQTPEGAVLRLRYAGLREGTLQPEYTTKATYTPPPEGDRQ